SEGGRRGLVNFLENVHDRASLRLGKEAFVVWSRNKEKPYVFSREQFWLTSYGLLDPQIRDVLDMEFGKQSFCEPFVNFPAIRELDEAAKDYLIGRLYHIREYSAAHRLTSRRKPAGPALVLDKSDQLLEVAVPDTRRLTGPNVPRQSVHLDLARIGAAGQAAMVAAEPSSSLQ